MIYTANLYRNYLLNDTAAAYTPLLIVLLFAPVYIKRVSPFNVLHPRSSCTSHASKRGGPLYRRADQSPQAHKWLCRLGALSRLCSRSR